MPNTLAKAIPVHPAMLAVSVLGALIGSFILYLPISNCMGGVAGPYCTFRLTMVVTPTGSGTVSPVTGYYHSGNVLTINANPKTGYIFLKWFGTGSGSYTGPNAKAKVTMRSNIKEIANFVRATSTSTTTISTTTISSASASVSPQSSFPHAFVSLSGFGMSPLHQVSATFCPATTPSCNAALQIFSPNPAGIASGCATTSTGTLTGCAFYAPPYPAGDYVITINDGTNHPSARFDILSGYVLILVAQPQYATLTASPGPVNSYNYYLPGTSVTITATPYSGFTFLGWSGIGNGSYTGTSSTATITMYSDITETANIQACPTTGCAPYTNTTSSSSTTTVP